MIRVGLTIRSFFCSCLRNKAVTCRTKLTSPKRINDTLASRQVPPDRFYMSTRKRYIEQLTIRNRLPLFRLCAKCVSRSARHIKMLFVGILPIKTWSAEPGWGLPPPPRSHPPTPSCHIVTFFFFMPPWVNFYFLLGLFCVA